MENISINSRAHNAQSESYLNACFGGVDTVYYIYTKAAEEQETICDIAFCAGCKSKDNCQMHCPTFRCGYSCNTCEKKCKKPCKRFLEYKSYIHKDDYKEEL